MQKKPKSGSGNEKLLENVSHDISIGDLLSKKLRRYISKLDGLKRGNLYEIVLRGVERPLFHLVLQETKWNRKKAANILGINRNTLRKKIKEYNLKDE